MIGEHKKRINLTLHEMTVAMLKSIALKTGLTKSEIVRKMFFTYTLTFWGNPDEELESWEKYAKEQNGNKNI